MTTTREWADSARAGAAALLAATLLHAAPSRADDGDATCEVPEMVVLRGSAGAVTFTRAGAHGTARDEVAIHLYPQEEARMTRGPGRSLQTLARRPTSA